jgi:molybdopterin-guanine dinucleotide biosynthesis protein
MRVAICGSQCVGKSTLIERLSVALPDDDVAMRVAPDSQPSVVMSPTSGVPPAVRTRLTVPDG